MLDPSQLEAFPQIPRDALQPRAPRLLSIWEITTWILPMAPEHLRRVLAADPDLPQGSHEVEGGPRWFTASEVAALRAHFAQGPRRARYRPALHENHSAPLLTMAQPLGWVGRSCLAEHLATAAALAGWRVLVIDAAPEGQLGPRLGAEPVAGMGLAHAFCQIRRPASAAC